MAKRTTKERMGRGEKRTTLATLLVRLSPPSPPSQKLSQPSRVSKPPRIVERSRHSNFELSTTARSSSTNLPPPPPPLPRLHPHRQRSIHSLFRRLLPLQQRRIFRIQGDTPAPPTLLVSVLNRRPTPSKQRRLLPPSPQDRINERSRLALSALLPSATEGGGAANAQAEEEEEENTSSPTSALNSKRALSPVEAVVRLEAGLAADGRASFSPRRLLLLLPPPLHSPPPSRGHRRTPERSTKQTFTYRRSDSTSISQN